MKTTPPSRISAPILAALLLAAVILLGSALSMAAPRAPWATVASPLLLVLGVLGADLVLRRGAGLPLRPSASTLLFAASLLVAAGILAAAGPADGLRTMFPLLGSSAVIVLFPRTGGACRWRRTA